MNNISVLQPGGLSFAHSPAPTALGLAVHLGWLSGDHGSEATAVRSLREGRRLSDIERNGEYGLANAFRQGGIMPTAWARARGADTRVIGISWIEEAQLILTRPSSGIRGVNDLPGRRVAMPVADESVIEIRHYRAWALRTLLTMLKEEGLSCEDVALIPVTAKRENRFQAETNALLRGQVDAIYVQGLAGVQLARTLGLATVADLRDYPDPRIRNNGCTLRVVTANENVLKRFPDVSNGFLKLAVDAARWAADNRAGTLSYAKGASRADEDLVLQAYGDNLATNLEVSLRAEWIAALKDYVEFLSEWRFIDRPVAIDNWIDGGPLREILRQSERRSA